MRWRPGHLALIVFQALWLNVILPGHTRGMITLPGTECSECGAATMKLPACCAAKAAHETTPTPKQRAACALCAFAATVSPPPPVDFVPHYLRATTLLPQPPPMRVVSIARIPTYFANAPPALS